MGESERNRCRLEQDWLDTICLMSNQDDFSFALDEFYELLRKAQAAFASGERRKYAVSGSLIAFIMSGHTDWKDTSYPYERKLQMHRMPFPEAPRYYFIRILFHNAENVRRILEVSGKTSAVYQGHFHPGQIGKHRTFLK